MSSNTIYTNPIFIPTQISGCQLWFDGNDPAGNGSIPANGSSITTWVDKSGRGKNLSGGSGANTFSTYGNRNSVLFNADRLQNTSAAVNVNTLTVFIAWLQKDPKTNACLFFLTDGNAYNSKGVGIYSDSTSTRPGGTSIVRVYPAPIGSEANANLPVATSSDVSPFNINSIAIDSTSSIEIFVNGTSGATKSNAVSRNVTANNAVAGSEVAGSNSSTSIANVSEILVYNVTLSSSQRQLVEGYLAWKWNAVNLLPSNHPYKNTPVYNINTIPRSLQSSIPTSLSASSSPFVFFRPTQITDCQLWLDGYDPNGNGSSVSNGSSISTWTDKSGAGNNGTSSGSSTPTFNNNAIVLNGSGKYNTAFTASVLSNQTFFMVFQTTTFVGDPAYVAGTQVGQLTFYTTDTAKSLYLGGIGSWVSQSSNNAVTSNVSYITGYQTTAVTTTLNTNIYLNGTSLTSTTLSPQFTGTPTTSILCDRITGNVYEIIGFAASLTTIQRQQVEGYLAWKWNLVGSLPANHPYKNAPPGLTVPSVPPTRQLSNGFFKPTSLTGCSIWLDAADSSTFTATGSTLSQWREKAASRIYSGSATLSTLNSYPSISFNGSQTMTTTTTLSLSEVSVNSANFTCFLVVFVSSSTAVNSSPFHVGLSSSRFMPFYNPTGGLFFDGATQSNPRLTGCTFTNNVRQIHVFNRNATVNMQFRLNGSLNNSGTFVTPANFDNIAYTAYLSASGSQVTGALQEAIYYSSDLGTQNIQTVEGYLAWKWGLQGSLPANHPWKKWPPPS